MLSFSALAENSFGKEDSGKEDLKVSALLDGQVCRHERRKPMYRPHRHDELEFNLVIAGSAGYLLGDRRYQLRRGMLVWLFPGQHHILLDESPDYTMWLGIFKPSLLRRICTTPSTRTLCALDPPGHFCRRLPEETASRLAGFCAELNTAREDVDRCNAGLGYAALSAWAAYSEADNTPLGTDVHPAVERAARLIQGDSNTLSVEEIGRRAGLSASHLSRMFAAQVGVSLVSFRNQQRLDRFLRLYGRGGRMTVLAAALEAGFGSYAQFHRVFTERMGCSPAAYRQKQRRG